MVRTLPTQCKKCNAYANTHSKLSDDKKEWSCEFCGFHNYFSERLRLPEDEYTTFVEKKHEGPKKEHMIIACIDISGSMGNGPENGTRLECM